MQIIKFTVVGALAALVHLASLWLIVNFLALDPVVANILAFFCAFTVSFSGQSLWTFNHKSHNHHAAFRYLIIQLLCSFLLNQALYTLLFLYTPLHYLVASFIVLITIPVITFTLSKYWAFR
ncbi:GtrA family protein [Endozoicomonas lisbonensis]|uniref:Flippase GtrA n=1 Tax=Endozoicomonas lisbonensis TaxID=3120522 RepID=A0ABV2SE59_9GAMM